MADSIFDFDFSRLNEQDFHDLFVFDSYNQNATASLSFDNLISKDINFHTNDIFNDKFQDISSPYVTVNQLKSKDVSEKFSLMHMNIRSLNKNFENLRIFLDNFTDSFFSVIGLTETWLTDNTASLFNLPGYHLINNDRYNRSGGGVAFYVKSNFDFFIRKDICRMESFVESLFIEIKVPNRKDILLGVIYRPPDAI